MNVTKLPGLKPFEMSQADQKCYTDTSTSKDDNALPVDAKLHGDNPQNSSRPRQDSASSMIDGPFGGRHPS